jgi:hypothetical protein
VQRVTKPPLRLVEVQFAALDARVEFATLVLQTVQTHVRLQLTHLVVGDVQLDLVDCSVALHNDNDRESL